MENGLKLKDACELLGRSKKSIGRYIKKGFLKPLVIRSKQGTKEYRFSLEDIEQLKEKIQLTEERIRQEAPDTQQDRKEEARQTQAQQKETRQEGQEEFLKDQLREKDKQIESLGDKIDQLIERDRETNILLKSLQEKVLSLEAPKSPEEKGQERQEERQPRQEKKNLIQRILNLRKKDL